MNVKALRKRLGVTQAEFWARVGLSQSCGSRHECGRAISKPVRMLLAIAYGNKRELNRALKRLIPGFKP